MKNLSLRLARIYFWTEKALLGALLAFFTTALLLWALGDALPAAVMAKLNSYALYLTLPLGMISVPVWLADWRFGWFKRSLLAGSITLGLVEGLALYRRLTPHEVWAYMAALVPAAMAVWPVFGAYFGAFRAAPAPEGQPPATPVKSAGKPLLPVFALLGGLAALTLLQLFRSRAAVIEERPGEGRKAATAAPVPPPVPAGPVKAEQSKEGAEQLIKDANEVLREAELDLKDAEETEQRVKERIKR